MPSADSAFDLKGMLQGLFETETVEDYTCIKCSIKHYLTMQDTKIKSKALKEFLT